jgi:hypothetical protein
MAMRAARFFAVLAAVLALGSCQVLELVFSSVFPGTVTLAKSQTDLSGRIASGDGSAFRLRVVQSGGSGYIILIGNLSSGITAYVYDLNLSQVATLTGFTTDGVMVDGGGYIVIGTQEYSPANFAPAGTTNGNPIGSYGITCGADGFTNVSTQSAGFGIASGGSLLNYTTYAYPWVAGGTPRSATLSSVLSNLRIDAILDDSSPTGNVTLAVSQIAYGGNSSSGQTCWFATTSKSNYSGGTVPANLLDSSPRLDHIDTGSIGFAQGSLMVYDSSAGRFLRIDPVTGSTQGSFYSGADISNTRVAYPVSGGSFYAFDTKTRVLTRYAPWW